MPAASAVVPSVLLAPPNVTLMVSKSVTLAKLLSVAAVPMVMVSVPRPPEIVSAALKFPAAAIVSLPAPPETLSLPAFMVIESLPMPPTKLSLPAPAMMVSVPAPPSTVLLPAWALNESLPAPPSR